LKIIINADDFGMSSVVNKAIYSSAKDGYLTSSTILVVAEEIDEAIEMTKELPQISFGIHLALTDDFVSLSSGKKFNEQNWKFNRLNIFQIPKIIKEFSLQIEKLRGYGVEISHIDTHHHIHRFPLVLWAVIAVAKKYKIKKIRTQVLLSNPKKANRVYRAVHNFILKSFHFKLVESYSDFPNFSEKIESDLGEQVVEVMCHPGSEYNDESYFNQEFYSKFSKSLITYRDF
jgi:predicted glycoside hydrolase/deacetylase ChbG (UPF0249 family)